MSDTGQYDIELNQHASFQKLITWEDEDDDPINLTGYTAWLQARKNGTLLVELTSGDGITLGGAAGTITLTISAEDTGLLPYGVGEYDLLLTSGAGFVYRLLEGAFTVNSGVTMEEVEEED